MVLCQQGARVTDDGGNCLKNPTYVYRRPPTLSQALGAVLIPATFIVQHKTYSIVIYKEAREAYCRMVSANGAVARADLML